MLVEGRRLFLDRGYTATSVDAVCDAAGVTKGAFFHHFSSKHDFASQVLAFIWQPVVDAHDRHPAEPDLRTRLAEHITFMASWIADAGRLMPLLAQEVGSVNADIRDQVRGYFATWMSHLEEILDAVVAATGADVDVEALKEFIVATTEGVPVASSQFGAQALANVSTHLVTAVMAEVGFPQDA